MVAGLEPRECSSVRTTVGVAHDIKLKVGITPWHNRVTGTIKCLDEHLNQFVDGGSHLLPPRYCPDAPLSGSLEATKEYIHRLCSGDNVLTDIVIH